MATIETRITRALLDHLDAIAVFSPKPFIVWPARRQQPPTNQMYLIAQVLLNDPITRGVSDQSARLQGILQITVASPITRDEGVVPGIEAAGLVAQHFKKGIVMDEEGVRVRIIRRPTVASPFPDGAILRTPVTIPFVHSV